MMKIIKLNRGRNSKTRRKEQTSKKTERNIKTRETKEGKKNVVN